MEPLNVFLHLAAAVLLLLWSVRMVRTGFERAYGQRLTRVFRRNAGNAVGAAATGMGLAILLQSSTAVGVLAAGFVASGALPVPTGIAALLGADLGSAVVVRLLMINLTWLQPALMALGVVLFLRANDRQIRQTGRILIGIALILVALKLIGEATEPIRDNGLVGLIVARLSNDPVTAAGIAALFAWLIHSSVATVLLLSTFAGSGMLPPETAIPMVLGANFGAGLIGVWLTRAMNDAARQVPLANALLRSGLALALFVATTIRPLPLHWLGAEPAGQIVMLHIAFNALLLMVGLPLVRPAAAWASLLVATPSTAESMPSNPLLRPPRLDRSVIGSPHLALANATREILRMGEIVETMLAPVIELLEGVGTERAQQIRALDESVNLAHREIKLYVAEVNRRVLDDADARKGIELTDVAINLEHVGDIIAKTLVPLAEEIQAKGLAFSRDGIDEIASLHDRVLANLRLALNVLVSKDIDSARQIVMEKERVRELERSSHEQHLQRLRNGVAESIATSNLHLEVLRGLKEINSLLASTAYPILIESGQLKASRLA